MKWAGERPSLGPEQEKPAKEPASAGFKRGSPVVGHLLGFHQGNPGIERRGAFVCKSAKASTPKTFLGAPFSPHAALPEGGSRRLSSRLRVIQKPSLPMR